MMPRHGNLAFPPLAPDYIKSTASRPPRVWAPTELHALEREGLQVTSLLAPSSVFLSVDRDGTYWSLKIVDLDSAEEAAIQALSAIPQAHSYIIPAVLIDCTHTRIIKMPYLALESWFRSDFTLYLAYLKVLVEGVGIMHAHKWAHLDVGMTNVLLDESGVLPRFYLIDFETTRHFPLGHRSIILKRGQVKPAEGLGQPIDPFAHDVYCIGVSAQDALLRYRKSKPVPPTMDWFIDVLMITPASRRPKMYSIRSIHRALEAWYRFTDSLARLSPSAPAKCDALLARCLRSLLTAHARIGSWIPSR